MTATALLEFKHRIESLTSAERLELMEVLWNGISQDASGYTSPAWHLEALRASEQAVAEGRATFTDWPEAEAELRRKLGLAPGEFASSTSPGPISLMDFAFMNSRRPVSGSISSIR